ncbi:hypothetical protein BOTBODRAFT_65877 [Botryobasidium botryosum FD-172 SS1]|uniref:Autophagy-related protein n=1 Tax=Botryobasidium botryosum (strain FD-172 SS1) TaxID=930990 RepID=A0A067MJP4_BOTB1|nr:hypothetical protein BOTBODRAFT_65877 [Botryobasidium botryosum FD-172 SS1]
MSSNGEHDGALPGKLRFQAEAAETVDELRTTNDSLPEEHTIPPSTEWATRRRELWSYYLFYIGNNGLAGFNFGPSQFQNLLFLAGYDRDKPPFSTPCVSSSVCVLPFLGSVRDVNSIVLITNGISFAIQAVIFLMIGAWADYGSWRPNITIGFTMIAIAVSFGWLGVEDPSKWKTGIALYMLGLIAYQGALTFWTAAFPGLARNLPEMQESKAKVVSGEKGLEDHLVLDSLSRNRISNISFTVSSAGEILILAVMIGILKGVKADESVEKNTRAFSILIAFAGAAWFVCALPWFIFEKRRPGLPLPPNTSFFTIGFIQAYQAFRECMKLKQTFLYLIFYFIIIVSYSTTQLTYLLLLGITTQMIGIYAFWRAQKYFALTTKTMLIFNVFWILLLTVWGLVGIWTDRFGFKNVWEVWAYQAYYGLMVCPWYAYSQTMISEVIPSGKEFLFFALFSIVGKTSAFIGPFVSSAIIDASHGNNNTPFGFLLALGVLSAILLVTISVPKSRLECEAFLKAEEENSGR